MICLALLRCEYRVEPLAVAARHPRFSWHYEGDPAVQHRWRITVTDEAAATVWDSGWKEGRDTNQIAYAGMPLAQGCRYQWQVAAETSHGPVTAQSWFETAPAPAVLESAEWITLTKSGDRHDDYRPCPYLRTEFAAGDVTWARLHVTAAGAEQMYLNGQRIGDGHLTPGCTDYHHRVLFQTYDVTALLVDGPNALGGIVNEGWYAGNIGPDHHRHFWGQWPSLCAVLEFIDSSGRHRVSTDQSWRGSYGPILSSSMLQGEVYDARRDLGAWATAGYDDSTWQPAVRGERPAGQVLPAPHEPIRATAEIAEVSRSTSPGLALIDFGQNLAGVARLEVTAPAGTAIRMRFGEVLDGEGRLYTENLRGARATDTYLCAGGGTEEWTPHFTFHGFRYLEVSGPDDVLAHCKVTAIGWSSVIPTAQFESDHQLLNQLHSNIAWGMRGNFLDIPTDCPQRDERLGWFGDAQVFAPTALQFADVAAFYTKWLGDIRDSIRPSGKFPDIAPCVVLTNDGSPGYGDAGVLVPWEIYRATGDRRVLAEMYPASCDWVRLLLAANPDGLWENDRMNDYGDWLAIGEETDKVLVATAYLGRSAFTVARMAEVLGEPAESHWADFSKVQQAFQQRYLRDGALTVDTQGAHVLALAFDLVPEQHRDSLARRLGELLEQAGHLRTGFLSVAHLMPLLSTLGRDDLAGRLLTNTSFPSWLYPVTQGATTIWERWDGWTEESGFQDVIMNSFNHYAFGAVGQWLHNHLVGIQIREDQPGYRHVDLRPSIIADLQHASATIDTINGLITADWMRSGDQVIYQVVLPPNVTGTVHHGDGSTAELEPGYHEIPYRLGHSTASLPHSATTGRARDGVGVRISAHDIRFPTSRELDGSDAMNPDPDYSAAYVTVLSPQGDTGHGLAFTIGRGNDLQTEAIRVVGAALAGHQAEELIDNPGLASTLMRGDSQLRWLGPDKGVIHMAAGAIVNALWDLKAKRAHLPLWQLLAQMPPEELVAQVDFTYLTEVLTPAEATDLLQQRRATAAQRQQDYLAHGLPAYTTSPGWLGYPLEKMERLATEAVGEGYRLIKLKVGRDQDEDVRRIAAARAVVGDEIGIAVDANQTWDVATAVQWMRALAPYNPVWIEEPTSPDDILGHAAIRQQVNPIKVATGEHIHNSVMVKQLLQAEAIDVLQIDATRVAGVNENLANLLMAAKFGIQVSPHAGGVGLCEMVEHLAAFNYIALGTDQPAAPIEFVDHLHEHFVAPSRVVGGRYQPVLSPGGGAEMHPESLARFKFPDGPEWQGGS